MALPLKSGLDLYNNEALRMRLHNLGADPTSDFGVGQVYFNTSTSEGSGKRVRIYDGSAFRSLAYFDEFTALQTKVNAFLDGGVDADGVLENLAEIQKFLDNYSSATDLSEILDTKLDKTGGTISGDIAVTGRVKEKGLMEFHYTDGTQIFLAHNKYAGSDKDGKTLAIYNGTTWSDILTSAGGTMNLASISSFIINRTNTGSPAIGFSSNGAYWGSIGFSSNGVPVFYDGGQVKYNFLHSGNVGEYALNTNGSNARPSLLTATINLNDYAYGYYSYVNGNNPTNSFGTNAALFAFRSYRGNDTWQIAFDGNNINNTAGPNFAIRGNFANSGWTVWYRIATTSGNVASATKLQTARTIWGQSFDGTGDVSGNLALANAAIVGGSGNVNMLYFDTSNTLYLGYGMNGVGGSVICGEAIVMRYGGSRTMGFILNSSGNVTIGTTNDNGEKLHVNGNVRATEIFVGTESQRYGRFTWASTGTADLVAESGNILRLGVGSTRSMRIETDGLISLLNDTTINGDLHVTGNIIADGEVSAGGAGEEGDAGTGTGGGDALIYSQEFTPTTTSITITHNLSATKGVIVQVWEKNGNYWDMVLVDVEEVDTNTVTLFFGKTETTVHKVVIMG